MNNHPIKNDTNLIPLLEDNALRTTLNSLRRGVEREMIRTDCFGSLSTHSHPHALGSALTHPYITTDFAEVQLELVTPALTDKQAMFTSLNTLHHFVAKALPKGEIMWASSMPPVLPEDNDITIANYGHSNAGQFKMRYREGLSNRYGKKMQMISGIHYNFSLPDNFWEILHANLGSTETLNDFISQRYFHLIRNALRHGWMVPYLFGASPAVDSSYLEGKTHQLEQLDEETYYLPWATSLRLSNIGYTSSEQSLYPISFNSKQEYLSDLHRALTQPSQRYLDLKQDQQLNTSVLQIENELYGSVRPKIASDHLRPFYAVCTHGVKYIELRSVDNNPFSPIGITEDQSHFLDVFLTYCALSPSDDITEEERELIAYRQNLVATQGRKPELMLPTLEGERSLKELGLALIEDMRNVALAIDQAHEHHEYQSSLEVAMAKFFDSSRTPSAQILAQMQERQLSHKAFILQLSQQHTDQYQGEDMLSSQQKNMVALASESLARQVKMEQKDEISFELFIQHKNQLSLDCDKRKNEQLAELSTSVE